MVVLSSSVDSDLIAGIGARLGSGVRICTTVSEARYRRWAGGGWKGRLALRFTGTLVHPLRLALCLVRAPRGTCFVVTTNPFFAPAVAVLVGRWRRHCVVHHVFDLYPDALEAAGAISRGGVRSRILSSVTRWVQRHCTAAVYLGETLRRHAEQRHGRAAASRVIDVAAEEQLFAEPPVNGDRPLRLHYGGQLGLMHDAATLVAMVRCLQGERESGRVGFDFRVGGARSGPVLALKTWPGVTAGPVLPAAEWRRRVAAADIGVVTLTPEGANVCLPSKTYALLAAGVAVLAVAPRDSDLARIVRETGAGWVVDNATPEARAGAGERGADLIRRLVHAPDEVSRCRRAARHAAVTRFGRRAIAERWRSLLEEIGCDDHS